jgi:hypothetical protein
MHVQLDGGFIGIERLDNSGQHLEFQLCAKLRRLKVVRDNRRRVHVVVIDIEPLHFHLLHF